MKGKQFLPLKSTRFIIRKADKNNTTVIWDKLEYIKEGMRQLSSATHFKEIDQLHITETHKKINCIIHKMHGEGCIDNITFKYLTSKKIMKPGRLYLLPKLHKIDPETIERVQKNPDLCNTVHIQGRPIVSLCGSPLEIIGKYIDKFDYLRYIFNLHIY